MLYLSPLGGTTVFVKGDASQYLGKVQPLQPCLTGTVGPERAFVELAPLCNTLQLMAALVANMMIVDLCLLLLW